MRAGAFKLEGQGADPLELLFNLFARVLGVTLELFPLRRLVFSGRLVQVFCTDAVARDGQDLAQRKINRAPEDCEEVARNTAGLRARADRYRLR